MAFRAATTEPPAARVETIHLENVRAVRADREQELEQHLVRRVPFRVGGAAVLRANLAELARPVREQERSGLVLERGVGRALRRVVAHAGEPTLRELILAAGIHAERVAVASLLPAAAPHQLGAPDETAVDRAPQRPIPERRIDAVDARREVGAYVVVAVRDRRAEVEVRALRDVTIAAQPSHVSEIAALV